MLVKVYWGCEDINPSILLPFGQEWVNQKTGENCIIFTIKLEHGPSMGHATARAIVLTSDKKWFLCDYKLMEKISHLTCLVKKKRKKNDFFFISKNKIKLIPTLKSFILYMINLA